MRVATSSAYDTAIANINERQSQLVRTQQQLSTGRKLLSAADDPMAAAQAERNRSHLQRLDLARRMNDFARTQLGQADNLLGSVSDLAQTIREGFVQAGNGALSPSDRATLATQFQGYRDELARLVNTADGSGSFVFGGQGASSDPFATTGTPAYAPVAGEQKVGVDFEASTVLDGRQVFMGVASGSGTSDIFSVLDGAIATLRDPAATPSSVTARVQSTLGSLDSLLDHVSQKRTEVGEQLRQADARASLLDANSAETQRQYSELMDVDYAKVLSDFSNSQTAQQAAMKTYAEISRMKLFDYL